ncbi:MAG TPA: hypothetical protein VKR62_09865 [Roseiarcus sp.]|nr:hypothetical protein [Roseiarcus sp.]
MTKRLTRRLRLTTIGASAAVGCGAACGPGAGVRAGANWIGCAGCPAPEGDVDFGGVNGNGCAA